MTDWNNRLEDNQAPEESREGAFQREMADAPHLFEGIRLLNTVKQNIESIEQIRNYGVSTVLTANSRSPSPYVTMQVYLTGWVSFAVATVCWSQEAGLWLLSSGSRVRYFNTLDELTLAAVGELSERLCESIIKG